MADLGQAYVQIIPKADGISGKITDVLSGGASEAGTKAGGLFSKGFAGKVAKGAAIGGAAMAAGVAVGANALKNGIKATAEYGDRVDKMSQKIGFSAEEYQKWDYVMQRAGTDINKMAPVMKTLSNAAESNSEAFQQLGISQEEVANMSQGELFTRTIEQLSQMEAGTERTALASKLLGRGATELGPLLNEGSAAIEDQMKIAEQYGMVMSDASVKASADFQDSLTTMQMTMTGLKNRMMAEFLPAATQVTDGISKMFTGDMSGVDDIIAGLEGIGAKIAEIAPKVLSAGAELIGKLIEGLMSRSGDIGEKVGKLAGSIVTKLVQKAPDILRAGVKLIAGLARGLIQSLPKVVSAIARIGAQIVKGLGSALWGKVTQAAEGIKQRFLQPIENLKTKVSGIIEAIKGFFHFTVPTPHIPVPYFRISPAGWRLGDLLKGSIPSLDVGWHAKAMDNPYMFSNATLFGAGEAGDEILYGRRALMNDIKEATSSGGDIVINLNYDSSDEARDMVRDLARGVRRYRMAGAI